MIRDGKLVIISTTELLILLMNKDNVTRADLARRLGKSKSFVTQALSGSRNMTLRTLSDIAHALGYRVEVSFVPK